MGSLSSRASSMPCDTGNVEPGTGRDQEAAIRQQLAEAGPALHVLRPCDYEAECGSASELKRKGAFALLGQPWRISRKLEINIA